MNNKFEVNMNENMKDIKFPMSMPNTPIGSVSHANSMGIEQTPLARAMIMSNWLNEICGC